MRTIEVGTAVSDEAGRVRGKLDIGALPDGTPVEIPVEIVRGAEDGPVLWLHGCVHGNEYCGTYIIHELMRSLKPEALKGTVVALPVLNLTAFLKNQRMSPFEQFGGGDLNRCFPGRADGSVTEQIAHAIYTPLKKYATHLVDFHTAFTPDTRWMLYSAPGGEVSDKAETMARAFGYRDTLPSPPDLLVGSAITTAAQDGIPTLIVEAGGIGPAFEMSTVEDAGGRLQNVMRALGMLEGEVTEYGPFNYFTTFAWCCATTAGLFERTVSCGDTVTKGQTIGRYYDLYGKPNGEATAPESGVVLAIHAGALMARGETLIHIGLNPREA
ncbi:succinylglutamate desuccinylase/aspartoacylase family protein [Microbaculum marinum]|uniref:Succinylglutamate desuccinylase/aspartoacylase family protein n=1 Tax=Microbaculum marinum TaxID=1764581 RepID=A0AAW9RUX6_9HYPH